MNKITLSLTSIVILCILAILFAMFLKKNQQNTNNLTNNQTAISTPSFIPASSQTPPTEASVKKYTLSDVATHKDSMSCWAAINGKVYDLTSFIQKHPGGSMKIVSICGKDGSAAFNGQHSGQSDPQNELESLYIGDVVTN